MKGVSGSPASGQLSIVADPQNSPPIRADAFGVVLIPGYVGFHPREERRGAARERHLRICAWVVADRDYRLKTELLAEQEKLAGKDFHRQRWHVWQRVEIENYLLSEAAFQQVIASKAGADVDPAQMRAAFEEAVEANFKQVRDQLMNAYGRHNREQKTGWESATIFHKAEADLKARWQGPGRLANCDAKVVLGLLYQKAHQQWG